MIRSLRKICCLALTLFVAFAGLCGTSRADEAKAKLTDGVVDVPIPPRKEETHGIGLKQLVAIAMQKNPRLRKAAAAIEKARGRFVQAGLYPNPSIEIYFDELGDVTGPQGINSLPLVSQEILTPGKRHLRKAVASKLIRQADLLLVDEKYRLITEIRKAYFEVMTLRAQILALEHISDLAKQAFDRSQELFKAKEVAELDLIQFRIVLNRALTRLAATKRRFRGAWRFLAATVGEPDLPQSVLNGSLENPLPDYDYDQLLSRMLKIHPAIRVAEVGVVKAELSLRRAKLERVPNLTLTSGFVRQNQNKSNDWAIGFAFPVPILNRNQGNILAARAEIAQSIEEVQTARLFLTGQLATAVAKYRADREQARRYKKKILPDAERAYRLSLVGFEGGQFEYLRVLEAQKSVSEVTLEYIEVLREAWQSASEIAGLILQKEFPTHDTADARIESDPVKPPAG